MASQPFIVTLKFPAFLMGVGSFKSFRCTLIEYGGDRNTVLVIGVLMRRKWMSISPRRLEVRENCVVSREFICDTSAAIQETLVGLEEENAC